MSARAGTLARPVLALLLAAAAARPAAAADQRITLGAGLGSGYDSNILEYSSDQLSLFEGGTRPDRFSLESSDDLVWNPALALGWELAGRGGRRHALRLRADGDFHQKNGTADFRAGSVGWRESWSRERRLSASWYALPSFYLRQLFDEDYVPPFPGMSRYRRAEFSLGIGSLDWSQRIGRSNSLTVGGQYERRRYNADFRERDSDTGQGELAWGWTRLPHRGELELRALYRVSSAKAEDGDEVPGVTPDDADLSYHGLGGGAHGEAELARSRRFRLTGDADYQFSTRDYDSDRPADRYHYGRSDLLHALELGLGVRWSRALRGRIYWHFESNTAKLGTAAPSTTDTGDYARSQVGVRLDWSRTVWRSRAADAESDE